MQKSENIADLVIAMVEARKKFVPLLKTGTAKIKTTKGAEFEYDYAQLPDLLNMVNPILAESGIWVSQEETVEQGTVQLVTWFFHSTGQYIEWAPLTLPIVSSGNLIHAIGTTISYARRYDLLAKLGLAGERDMDASELTGKALTGVDEIKKPKAKGQKPEQKSEPFQDDELPEPTKGKPTAKPEGAEPATVAEAMKAKRKVIIDEIAEILQSPVFTEPDKEMMKRNIHESNTLELLGTLKSQCLEVEKIRNAKIEQGE